MHTRDSLHDSVRFLSLYHVSKIHFFSMSVCISLVIYPSIFYFTFQFGIQVSFSLRPLLRSCSLDGVRYIESALCPLCAHHCNSHVSPPYPDTSVVFLVPFLSTCIPLLFLFPAVVCSFFLSFFYFFFFLLFPF